MIRDADLVTVLYACSDTKALGLWVPNSCCQIYHGKIISARLGLPLSGEFVALGLNPSHLSSSGNVRGSLQLLGRNSLWDLI